MDGPPRSLCQLGGDHRVVAGRALGAEAAAHEAADDAHLVLRELERLGDLVPDAPKELSRGVDDERVALPFAGGLVRLERVVQDALRAVLGLDHGVRLGDAALDVAALVIARVGDEGLLRERLLGVEQRLEHLPLDVNRLDCGARLRDRVCRDRRDRLALVVRLVGQRLEVARPDHSPDARHRHSRLEVEPGHACTRVRRAEHGCVQHSGQPQVLRVAGLAARAGQTVDPGRRAADRLQRPLRPLFEDVLLDDDPLLGVAALDLLLGLDQPRHQSPSPRDATIAIARSIFG